MGNFCGRMSCGGRECAATVRRPYPLRLPPRLTKHMARPWHLSSTYSMLSEEDALSSDVAVDFPKNSACCPPDSIFRWWLIVQWTLLSTFLRTAHADLPTASSAG